MTDMLKSITPKSSQLNADDLIGDRTLTIRITKVTGVPGEQPIAFSYEGDGGKPYMPCKSMRRVIVNAWGSDGHKYVGRYLTLYRDDKVMFGGIAVGGLRISHMSDITAPLSMALTASKSVRKPYTVKPLIASKPDFNIFLTDIKACKDLDDLESTYKEAYRLFTDEKQRGELVAAKNTRKAELTATEGAA